MPRLLWSHTAHRGPPGPTCLLKSKARTWLPRNQACQISDVRSIMLFWGCGVTGDPKSKAKPCRKERGWCPRTRRLSLAAP